MNGFENIWKNPPKPRKVIQETPNGIITCLDAITFLRSLNDESVDIIFLDPPFNLNKKYGKISDKRNDKEYEAEINLVLERSAQVLKPGGSLFLYHIPKWAIVFVNTLLSFLTFQHWIALSMKNGFVRGKRLYPAHYALLYFTKGNASHFKRPKILPQRCRHCDSLIKDYGGYKDFISDGINLSDFWEDTSPVRHKKYKNRVANELPEIIPMRITQISGFEGAILVDPYAGSGTSAVVCKKNNIFYMCNDIERENAKLIKERIEKFTYNELEDSP